MTEWKDTKVYGIGALRCVFVSVAEAEAKLAEVVVALHLEYGRRIAELETERTALLAEVRLWKGKCAYNEAEVKRLQDFQRRTALGSM